MEVVNAREFLAEHSMSRCDTSACEPEADKSLLFDTSVTHKRIKVRNTTNSADEPKIRSSMPLSESDSISLIWIDTDHNLRDPSNNFTICNWITGY